MLNVWESQKEKNMVFAVIEDRGDRVVIAEVNCSMPITPTELVSASDIRIIGDTCNYETITNGVRKASEFMDYNPDLASDLPDYSKAIDDARQCL